MGQQKLPIPQLQQIFSQFGSELLNDPLRLKGLIRDYLGDDPSAHLLIKSLEHGVLKKVLDIGGGQADPLQLDHLTKSLSHDNLYDLDRAKQIVELWHFGLQAIQKASPPEAPHDQSAAFWNGVLVSPSLQKFGWQRRWGWGRFISGFGLDSEHILLVFTGGVGLFRRNNAQPLAWIETVVVSTALAPNRQLLAVGLPSGLVELWDLKEGRCRYPLDYHLWPITAIEFSNDSCFIASGDSGGTIVVWDTVSGWLVRRWEIRNGEVFSLTFNPDNHHLISTSSDFSARVYDLVSEKPVGDLPIHEPVRSTAFSPDGRFLLTAGEWKHVTQWEWGSKTPLKHLIDHLDTVRKVQYLPSGRILLVSSPSVVVLDTEDLSPLMRWDSNGFEKLDAIVLPDGEILIVEFGEKSLRVLEAENQTIWLDLEDQFHAVQRFAIFPRSDWMACSDGPRIQMIKVQGDNSSVLMEGHRYKIHDLAFSPDGCYLISCGADGSVRLWDALQCKPLGVLLECSDWLNAVCFLPDGRVAVGGDDRHIAILTIPDGSLQWDWENHTAVRSLTCSPDGRLLVIGGEDGSITVWDVQARQMIGAFPLLRVPLTAVHISPDGRNLAVGGEDGSLKVFALSTRKELDSHKLTAWVTCMASQSDRKQLAVGCGDGSVWFFSGFQLTKGQPLRFHCGPIAGLAFSPDGGQLVSASKDGMIISWSVEKLFKILDRKNNQEGK